MWVRAEGLCCRKCWRCSSNGIFALRNAQGQESIWPVAGGVDRHSRSLEGPGVKHLSVMSPAQWPGRIHAICRHEQRLDKLPARSALIGVWTGEIRATGSRQYQAREAQGIARRRWDASCRLALAAGEYRSLRCLPQQLGYGVIRSRQAAGQMSAGKSRPERFGRFFCRLSSQHGRMA